MTLTEALPMLKDGLSLADLQAIAEKKRTDARPSNVVSLSAVRAAKKANALANST